MDLPVQKSQRNVDRTAFDLLVFTGKKYKENESHIVLLSLMAVSRKRSTKPVEGSMTQFHDRLKTFSKMLAKANN